MLGTIFVEEGDALRKEIKLQLDRPWSIKELGLNSQNGLANNETPFEALYT